MVDPSLRLRRLLTAVMVVGLAIGALSMSSPALTRGASAQPSLSPIPVFAYYYIWFDVSSWDRAKIDYPLLGRYSSDDAAVMRTHIEWAKKAGINGFIVSWKSSPKLDARLATLVKVASEEQFKLAIIYQGLDFERKPISPLKIGDDLDEFAKQYGTNPVFDVFGKPLVIISGTWQYTPAQIQGITAQRRDQLLILASEKKAKDYDRLKDLVDGDAYYWSSVNPGTFGGYQEKLDAMSTAVHRDGGLWIAPAAVGFDARQIGGTTVVDRQKGQNLRTQFNAAVASSPDAVGLISWNEFSENSQIEPSVTYGDGALKVMADLRGTSLPSIGDFDSSAPEGTVVPTSLDGILRIAALAVLVLAVVVGGLLVRRRGKSATRSP